MLVATWNVNSLNARLPRVEEWVAEVQPDVLMMQETKLADDKFPHLTFSAMGYESAHFGEGRWNGVAIMSKVGLDEVHSGFYSDEPEGWDHPAEARLIWATCGPVSYTHLQRLVAVPVDLTAQQVEVLRCRRGVAQLDVVLGGQDEEPFDAGRAVLGALAFVSVG